MLNNFLKSALQFLRHNRVFATINLLGLTIALTISFVILLYVINELSYNHSHKNRSRVFKVLSHLVEYKLTRSETPFVLAEVLKEQFPQIEKAIRVRNVPGFRLKLKDEFISIDDPIATDSDIFDIFTLPLVSGSNKNLLDDQNSIIISRDLSEKFFTGMDPVGQEIVGLIDNVQQVFTVRAVFENIPVNSTFRAQCFVNSKWSLEDINKTFNITNADQNWLYPNWKTWVLLSKDCNPNTLEDQFRSLEVKYMGENPPYQYSLQNLGDVYFNSAGITGVKIMGNKKNVKVFSAIAFLILLVATLNYIILSTAISTKRGLEIGIRKTFGADKRSIKYQLLSESVLLAMLVLPIALILMRITFPYAEILLQTKLSVFNSNIPIYISIYMVLILVIGTISGLYTSTYLSSLKIIDIIKPNYSSGKHKQFFRSFLIVLQLTIFCLFVSCIIIIQTQYKYALNKDTGYFTKDVLLVDLGKDFKGYSAFINNIKSNPNVIMASGSLWGLPSSNQILDKIPHFQDKNLKIQVESMLIDYNYLKTLGITLLEGREFSQDFGSDLTNSVILNETAIKQLGITEPLGKQVGGKTVVGIVKDFNLHSIHSNIPPLMILMTDKLIRQVAVHYKQGSLNSILPMIETEWKKAAPGTPIRYAKIEETIKNKYSSERDLSTLLLIFAVFTLLISALGLFGLTLFIARSRTKEIGIKKVFGSSELPIVLSFLLNNFLLVMIATLISIPITIHFMTKWLSNFAYKTNISVWVFLLSFIIASLVVLLTVFFHSYRASRINPINALRNE